MSLENEYSRTPAGRKRESGSVVDYMNRWDALQIAAHMPDDLDTIAMPIPSYQEFVVEKGAQPEVLDSDKPRIEALDALAAEFNAERDQIIADKDVQKLEAYSRRANDILGPR